VYLDYTKEQESLRGELRAYMNAMMTDELRDELTRTEGGGPLYHEAMRELGRDGWLGIGWPKAYGGRACGPIEEFIFFDEVQRAGFPPPILTLSTVGPTLMKYGTEAQKQAYLPEILQGTCHFSIGYSEPSGGTDLAGLTTRAERVGDEYVINGQKIWTSLADHADYIWLAARTDPNLPRHKGISVLIVPANAPGVSISYIATMGHNNTHAVYLEDVRVPVANLVGEENGGWRLITSQLNHERVAINAVGPIARLTEETVSWSRDTRGSDGQRVIDRPWVQTNLAKVVACVDTLKLLNWQQAWNMKNENLGPADASAIKVYGSEMYVEVSRLLFEVLGAGGLLKRGSPGALLHGELERFYRLTLVLTFGGGTNEVQRDIIAMVGLGLPRDRR
jgi:3-oxocholest-4-en-26-oyl-CoA dehydrogenase alpha subunit